MRPRWELKLEVIWTEMKTWFEASSRLHTVCGVVADVVGSWHMVARACLVVERKAGGRDEFV